MIAVLMHCVCEFVPEADDKIIVLLGVTVIVLVAVALVHPPVPLTVYVIVAVPAATPVTTPVALTVATEVLLDDQVPPEAPFDENVVVLPAQIDWLPDKVPAIGGATTTIVPPALNVPPLHPTKFTVNVLLPAVVTVPDIVTTPFCQTPVRPGGRLKKVAPFALLVL